MRIINFIYTIVLISIMLVIYLSLGSNLYYKVIFYNKIFQGEIVSLNIENDILPEAEGLSNIYKIKSNNNVFESRIPIDQHEVYKVGDNVLFQQKNMSKMVKILQVNGKKVANKIGVSEIVSPLFFLILTFLLVYIIYKNMKNR